ncbi:hypothetical protein EJK51_0817 [Moraxella catarrhalis]|nr:hypothetical protein EJK52_0819 [Moraxella catarrhalis]AZQ90858.1 hypothetical protein EJK51_0817 [Moraxella catarrhalis]
MNQSILQSLTKAEVMHTGLFHHTQFSKDNLTFLLLDLLVLF